MKEGKYIVRYKVRVRWLKSDGSKLETIKEEVVEVNAGNLIEIHKGKYIELDVVGKRYYKDTMSPIPLVVELDLTN